MPLPSTDYAIATIQTLPTASLTDFSLMIDLSNLPAGWWTLCTSADGTKMRVAKDDGTELAFDPIDFDNGANTGLVRAKYSGTLPTSGTIKVRVYPSDTGNSSYAVGDTYGRHNAYDASWAVYYPNGKGTNRISASYATTDTGTVSLVTGKLGSASDYENTAAGTAVEYADTGFAPSSGTYKTASAWINIDTFGSIVAFGTSEATDKRLYVGINASNKALYGWGASGLTGVTTLSTGTWYRLSIRSDGSTNTCYVNTTSDYSSGGANWGSGSSSSSMRIGCNHAGTAAFDGDVQECQVHSVNRANAWEVEDYHQVNNNATFWGTWTLFFGQTIIPPTAALGITTYAPTATGDPTLFEYFPAGSAGASSSAAATSIALTSTPPIGANIGLLLMAFDNTGSGADGDYSEVTGVTDNKGNSWHKLAEHSNTNGAAGAGATVSVWYCEVDPNTFSSTITTATLSSSIASRCVAMIYCRSETLSLYAAEVLTSAVDASASYGSLTTSLAAKNRMYLRVCAQETAATSDFSATAGFSTLVNAVQVATMGLRAELKIATSASETSNPTTGASSDNASVFIALEADAAGGDADHTAINTYSMTGVSDAADEVTQITPISLGVNSNTADEVTQITPISLGINVSAEDEVTQIVMYSITSQPIPVPPTTVLGITSFEPSLASGTVTVSPVTPPLTAITFAPVITAEATMSVIVPTTELGITSFEPSPPMSMTVIVPTAELGIVPRVPRVLTPGTPGGEDCCCCCWEATVTVSVRFSARHSVR